jgi:methylmalonyl-CoA/ethylmalonyl-CoA epimerase
MEDKQMSEARLPDVKQDRFIQIGIVVKSVDETIKYFQEMFGFKDFEVRYADYPTATYYGQVAGYKGKRGFFFLGPIQIELIELVSGKTIHEDFLNNKGEGLNHLGFRVDDLESAKKAAEKAGLNVIQSFTRPDGTGFAYIDSDRTGGVIIEMIQRAKQS